ncbi:MAG: hypothetical protein ABGW98_15560 [Myxococcales bacterium]|jgi:hypothetical protein
MVSFRWGKATETRDDVAVSLRVLGVVLEALVQKHGFDGMKDLIKAAGN